MGPGARRGFLIVLSLGWALAAQGQHAGSESPVLQLPAPLRAALIEEMQQVDANAQRIASALPRADWSALEDAARTIRGAFILERKLSAEQRAELHHALPEPFLALDARFHELAGRLAAAARHADGELAAFYAYKLSEACVSCHARYARHRFPGFAAGQAQDH